MKLINIYLFVATLLLSYNAHAHESVKTYNQISLDATASTEVENDTMVVSLSAQEEGSKAATISNKVNEKINWVLKYLAQHKEIKVETENYSTTPVYNNNQVIAWRVRQALKLESTNMPLMSEVLGELQERLNLSGISFDVSREKREQETQLLIDQAITAYSKRATQIANKLQRDNYKIVNMHVTTSSNPIQQRYRKSTALMTEASSSVVAPTMAAGDRTLSVRVNGSIELE